MEITLVPIAGLCNRMNAITSGLQYLKNNPNCKMEILWWKSHDCRVWFSDLFEDITPNVKRMHSLIKDRPSTLRNLYIPGYFRKFFYDFAMTPIYNAQDFDKLTEGKKKIYVACHNNWNQYLIKESLADIFRPTQELRNRISDITKDWNKEDVIGLHIRRTDNAIAIEKSPISRFYTLMDSEIDNNCKVRFYLATDDEKIKQDMKKKYGERIITLNLSLRRNTTQGMKDAVVDLFCLGSTSKIIGSHHSTYSIIASQLYNIDLIV